MTLHGSYDILQGDCRDVLATLPDQHFHCCVTSPPYFGLRDYGCDGQIGLEPTPDDFVAAMVEVFRGVWRVLRDDGVVWLNLGDSYAAQRSGTAMPAETLAGGCGGVAKNGRGHRGRGGNYGNDDMDGSPRGAAESGPAHRNAARIGLKHKDMIGIPWRCAFALQADGWYLRDAVIWHKPAPMPGSQRDRCTNAYEFIFQLTKNARYYFDMEAVKEGGVWHGSIGDVPGGSMTTVGSRGDAKVAALQHGGDGPYVYTGTRTPRNVWTIPHEPCHEAHFATFPSAIPDKCIRASTSEYGCCLDCGAPYERIVERKQLKRDRPNEYVKRNGQNGTGNSCANTVAGVDATTLGWRATCDCDAGEPVPCRVIEPFCGAGTTLLAATRLGRDATGIELNPDYIDIARRRIEQALRPSTARSDIVIDSPLFATSTNGPNSGPIPVRLGNGESET